MRDERGRRIHQPVNLARCADQLDGHSFTKTQPGADLATRAKFDDWTCVSCGRTYGEIKRRYEDG
jgi:hypothetical protein